MASGANAGPLMRPVGLGAVGDGGQGYPGMGVPVPGTVLCFVHTSSPRPHAACLCLNLCGGTTWGRSGIGENDGSFRNPGPDRRIEAKGSGESSPLGTEWRAEGAGLDLGGGLGQVRGCSGAAGKVVRRLGGGFQSEQN